MRAPMLSFVRLTAALCLATTLLSACTLGDILKVLAGPPETRTVVKVECPDADRTAALAPPDAVVEAIRPLTADPEVSTWLATYERHLEKLESC